ncbi:hypothetical protein [Rubripirellula obstinata]|uniref:hypothetical protein n=1 Tax=Rubripirellula obstinata TaxID=406547 RepID=UPI000832591C|nr:hypothetical protein [Rubripirellula obstinata]
MDEPKSETPVIQTDPVIEAIAANTALIQQLLDQVGHQDHEPDSIASDLENGISDEQLHDEVAELRHRNDELLLELQRRQSRIDELTQQTEDLAAQVVQSGVQQTLATPQSGTSDALSWEERKQLILQQLETDTFDADEFVESIAEEINATETMAAELQSPKELLDELVSRLQRSESELAERKIEIGELRMLLDQQSETREGGVAIGAAAIAQMVDSDELVMQERERLQTLQDQWEEKFRQSEIEASLERAKLSRERQQLAKKTEQLEEELEHLRREEKQSFDPAESGTSRRWLAKLGLSDAD